MEVVLSIGANCGDKEQSVRAARDWVADLLDDCKSSDIYLTPAVGHSTGSYANCVVAGEYSRSIETLNILCKEFEESRGRDSDCRNNGTVPVDIDIVIAGNIILREWDFRQQFFQQGFKEINSSLHFGEDN